jgi:hypothetical protein
MCFFSDIVQTIHQQFIKPVCVWVQFVLNYRAGTLQLVHPFDTLKYEGIT